MKKIIAIILSISLMMSLLPSVSMASTAAHTADTLYENSLKLVSAINRNFSFDISKNDLVSRGDFLRLVLGLYNVNYTSKKNDFVDVSPELAPYISHALDTGMIETGMKFYPDNPVSFDMAVKIAVEMTGYKPKILSGGYLMAANSADLLSGLDGTEMNYRNVVVLLANILNTKLMIQSVYGESSARYVVSDETFLETYHNIVFREGIVKANMFTSRTSVDGATPDNCIIIDYDEYKCSEPEYLGYNVRAYYNKDTRNIVAIYKVDNREVTTTDVSAVTDLQVEYWDDYGKAQKLTLDSSYQFIYNGRAYMHAGYEAYFTSDEAEITFVDNNDDGRYDIVFVWDYDYMNVRYVDLYNQRIFDTNSEEYIDLSADDCKYEVIYCFASSYEKAELADVAANASITYCLSKDGKYCKIFIAENNISGKLTEINKETKSVKIGDLYYTYNSYFEKYYLNTFGQQATFSIAHDGTLISASQVQGPGFKYAWLYDVAPYENGLSKSLMMKLYTQDGEMAVFRCAQDIVVDNDLMDYKKAYDDVLGDVILQSMYDRLIKYCLNDEGEISIVDTVWTPANAAEIMQPRHVRNNLTKYYQEDSCRYRNSISTLGNVFRVGSSTVVFKIPSSESLRNDEKNFYADMGISLFSNNSSYKIAAYNVDDSGLAECVIYEYDASSSAKSGDSALLCKKRRVYYPDEGEIKSVYDVYFRGKYTSYFAQSSSVETAMEAVDAGDMIRISVNSRKEIVDVLLDYDVSADSLKVTSSVTGSVGYLKGYLDGYDGTYMKLITDMDAQSLEDVAMSDYHHINTGSAYEACVVVTRSQSGSILDVKVDNIDPNGILTFKDAGQLSDKVVVRRESDYPGLAAIYRFVTK